MFLRGVVIDWSQRRVETLFRVCQKSGDCTRKSSPGRTSLVTKEIVAAARRDHAEALLKKFIEMRHIRAVNQQVGPLRTRPPFLQLSVVDKDLLCPRSIAAVFEIVAAAVPEQRGFVGVEEDRREGIVGVSFDQDAGLSASEGVGQRFTS